MFVGGTGFWLEGILYCSFSPLLNRVKATDHCSFVLPGLLSHVRLQLYHGCLGFKSKFWKLSHLGVSHLEGFLLFARRNHQSSYTSRDRPGFLAIPPKTSVASEDNPARPLGGGVGLMAHGASLMALAGSVSGGTEDIGADGP